jgi:gliding motility-associated protein GldM
MWFNPLIWMMRNSMQLVHEYLADEGALSTGIDKLKYQALLINQVTEERLICLSSSFNHSLIKKRMIMMTKSKFNQRTKLKILTLVPVAVILFLGVACINGQNKGNAVTAIEPVRMNVFYVGVDNPIKIAASGYNASELSVSVDNGTITGKNGEYLVRPAKEGTANVIVSNSSGKEIQKTAFRVKNFPDPIAAVKTAEGLKTNGNITKKELLDAKGIIVSMNNFDFDINFTVESFVLSYTLPGKFVIVEDVSKSDKFSEKQIEGIKSLIQWQKVTIEAITVVGPDGTKRKLNPMVFLISGE